MSNRYFQRGAGVYTCIVCTRRTRGCQDSTELELCSQCYDLSADDNMHNDDGTKPDAEQMAHYENLLAVIVARGGDGERVKQLNDYLWTGESA